MNREEVVSKMRSKPWALSKGKNHLAKDWHCSPADIEYARNIIRNEIPKKKNRILFLDIETAPMRSYTWGRWNQNVALCQTISDWFMLCWSAKWAGEEEVMGMSLNKKEVILEDDKRICEELWHLLDESDVVIAYNGKRFDIPKINTRFLVNKMYAPSPYIIVDPIETARKKFAFSSNKMDNLATQLGLANKLETDFELWKDCMEGDTEALEYMLKYNKMDVVVLENVYNEMKGWISNSPNMNNILSTPNEVCPTCASRDYTVLKGKYYYTGAGKYQVYRCNKCGGLFRDTTNLAKFKLRSLAR